MSSQPLKYESNTAASLLDEVETRSGQNLKACYQCRRCAAGCPVGEETGVTPDRLVRMIMLGDREAAMSNLLVWKCVACYTCGTRCPNNIQTARITEALKQMGKQEGIKPCRPRIADFHDAFMTSTRHLGRFNEIEGMAIYEAKTAVKELLQGKFKAVIDEALTQAKFGAAMSVKKRMHAGVDMIKNRSELKGLFKKSKKR
jgi:heterodisulfide reductase subunit C2